MLILSVFTQWTQAQSEFVIAKGKDVVHIVYDADAPPLTAITARLLAEDIFRVSGVKPETHQDLSSFSGRAIIIGTASSSLVGSLTPLDKPSVSALKGQWESYHHTFVDKPTKNIEQALIITGSDLRGMAYGVFALSEELGVSPWYWWADVPVERKKRLSVKKVNREVGAPSVKYRGIFLNDEGWGLRPWAAKTFEPEVGNIGPRTYAKIFELLLRLKGNLLWPAMHPGTDPFFSNKANIQVAKDWDIVVGSSHAEPMLRNNVGEWNKKEQGQFNYLSNSETIQRYWLSRVKESQGVNAIYTLGMRGIHDSGMEGVSSVEESRALTQRIIGDQRRMLTENLENDGLTVPQALIPYKEVLKIYNEGLNLPEDVTLVWPDDNYGYIRRLSTKQERTRSGGAGVYYHASYWGRPHDYLWLSSTHPALIREEMFKAYRMGARDIWVLNVGDIKPLEYATSLFLDMAYDAHKFENAGSEKQHLHDWLGNIFKHKNQKKMQDSLSEMLWQYYDLAFERRPEFMGWSRTEPTTSTTRTDYNHFGFGDEAEKRIKQYEDLQRKVETYAKKIPPTALDAYYQLMQYPILSAAFINKKFLYLDKANYYREQNRLSAERYEQQSREAYQDIAAATEYYNSVLASGKWAHMMSMEPRKLPVYLAPENIAATVLPANKKGGVGFALEGSSKNQIGEPSANLHLPTFTQWGSSEYFVDIYLSEDAEAEWRASASAPWLRLSSSMSKPSRKLSGTLNKENDELRIWVSVDWVKLAKHAKARQGSISASIQLDVGTSKNTINIQALNSKAVALEEVDDTFIESNGYLSIHAEHYHNKENAKGLAWEELLGLGRTGSILQTAQKKFDEKEKESPALSYDFYSFTEGAPTIYVYCLPVHPLNNQHSLRLAVSVDDGPPTVVDFKELGRSDTWKENVLANSAVKSVVADLLKPGKHTLKISALDPGVALDRIEMDFGGLLPHYGVLPETKLASKK